LNQVFLLIGLFSQAIMQSGSPIAFWAMHNQTANLRHFFTRYAEDHGCAQRDIDEVVECLRELPWQDFNFSFDLRFKVGPAASIYSIHFVVVL
jgi:hypothetical protein